MKLNILSDVHLEFGKWPKQIDVNAIEADVTILAGDIGVGLQGLEWALTIERPVVYVMGNHEFYGQRPMADLWRKAREKVAGTHVHLLENESVQIGDVRFLGCTLWTDFAIHGTDQQEKSMSYAHQSMTDYAKIYLNRRGKSNIEFGTSGRSGGDRLTPKKTLALHQESRALLERELSLLPSNPTGGNAAGKTVVVSHHAPSALSLVYEKPASKIDAAYASNLDALVEKADLWVHGHTHIRADYRIGSSRVVSNPRGYSGRDRVDEFNPFLVVEV